MGDEIFAMPEDLDPTTARLVSELSAMILPGLSKSLASAIPSVDFNGAIERTNRTAQDMRTEIVKALRSTTDDSRAGRSMIMQSIGTLLEEIAALRKNIDKLPGIITSAVKENSPEIRQDDSKSEAIIAEIDSMSERIDTLTQGIKAFFETYAEHRENDTAGKNITEILRPSVDPEMLSGLEGLVKAEGKTHSTELAELSREISAMTEENGKALVHEVREAVAEEISVINPDSDYTGHSGNDGKYFRLMKITAGMTGAGVILLLANLVMLWLK